MNHFTGLFGAGNNLTASQMILRAIIVFFIALILIRISGRRSFGIQTAFDNVLVILLGAILSRAVVGASPFFPTVFACIAIAVLHRLFAYISVFFKRFSAITIGKKILLYKDGRWFQKNMIRALVNKEDALHGVRMATQEDSLQNIEAIYMEINGHISAVKKKNSRI